MGSPVLRRLLLCSASRATEVPEGITGLIAWWKADAGLFQNSNGTTAASANNDPVGYWGDSVGTRHIIEATAGERPLLQTALPSILFDGTDDRLAYAGAFTDVVGSVVIVFKTEAAFTTRRVILSSADEAAADVWFEIGIAADGRIYIESNAAGIKHTVNGSSFLEVATSYVLTVTHDGTDYYAQIGAVEQNPLTIENVGAFAWFGDVAGADNIVLGGTVTSAGLVRPFKGEIMEVAVYSGDIT